MCAFAKDRPDERLKAVVSVFVAGTNQAAEGARDILKSGKTCLALATKSDDADAVLEITAESQTMGGSFGSMGGRQWIASGTLTLKSKDQVWSRSEREPDRPLKSGAKTAGELMIRHLAADAACHERVKH